MDPQLIVAEGLPLNVLVLVERLNFVLYEHVEGLGWAQFIFFIYVVLYHTHLYDSITVQKERDSDQDLH